MAQVGRISGPLLTANLERNGIDLKISNTVSSSPVLKLDVTGKRIGIGTDSPIAELQVPSSLNTQNFIATGTVNVADFSLSNQAINVSSGNIIVNSGSLIEASAVATDDIKIEENNIYGTATQANITLKTPPPNPIPNNGPAILYPNKMIVSESGKVLTHSTPPLNATQYQAEFDTSVDIDVSNFLSNFPSSNWLMGDMAVSTSYYAFTMYRFSGWSNGDNKCYVFNRSTNQLVYAFDDSSTSGPSADEWGATIAMNDSYLAVANYYTGSGGESVDVYDLNTGSLIYNIPNAQPGGVRFGASMCITPDGAATHYLGVAAPYADVGSSNRGAAYVYRLPDFQRYDFFPPTNNSSDYFGIGMDMNKTAVAIAAPGSTQEVYIYSFNNIQTSPSSQSPEVTIPKPESGGSGSQANRFGGDPSLGEGLATARHSNGVCLTDSYIIIASASYRGSGSKGIKSGKVYQYDLSGNLLRGFLTPSNAYAPGYESGAQRDRFGASIDATDSYIVIGATSFGQNTILAVNETPAENFLQDMASGTFYVFDASTGDLVSRSMASWYQSGLQTYDGFSTSNTTLSAYAFGENFGAKVAIDGDNIFAISEGGRTNQSTKPAGYMLFYDVVAARKVDIQSNLDVNANLHATGNITFGGNITLGSGAEDDITFAADVASNIVPDADNTYIFGRNEGTDSTYQRLSDTQVETANATNAVGDRIFINGIDYSSPVGNSFFVDPNGDDTARGDHPQGAFKTIKHALSAVDSSAGGPTTVIILAGTYTEEFPFTVPSQTNIVGAGFREVVIKPTTATQDKDCFLLTGETTVSNLTVMDFFYNSSNDTGYGFRFADNAVTSTRSPYVQNVSVITKGTPITVTASSTLSVNSQENNPRGITFNNDGTKMFIVGAQGDDVNEYTLSVGFDLSSTVNFIDSFPVPQCPNPTAVKFNTDGTKMFVTGTSNNNVHEYALSTGFDVSTAGFTQTLVTTVDSDNFGLDFNNDGTKMYITGNSTDSIYEFNLSSAFNISTATLNQSVYLNPIDDEPFGIEFNTDGTRMFIVGTKGNGVDEFKLTTGFDISTATHMGFYFVGNNPSGIHISPDGTKMFIIGNQSDLVKSFDLGTSYRVAQDNDPRGFEVGNAGRGALVDGSVLNASSTQASMLFHSVTFITPGAIGLRMKDGVRVEWLNSFTYFADIGIKAENGGTGFVSPHDGSTRNYGAEIRSIGSANVYGNKGAVADGNDCLMYLIQHNMAYIGTGSNKDNDKTLRIEANETVELNSGKIYFQTTDGQGKFKVGDNFFADFDTGTTSVDANTVAFDTLSEIRINTGNETTFIDGVRTDVGNFVMSGNTLSTSTGNMTIDAITKPDMRSDVLMNANLDITGNFSIGQTLTRIGDELSDTVSFNVDLDQDLKPGDGGLHSLGSTAKRWKNIFVSEANIGNVKFFDNQITTNVSNADLDLVANGSGNILFDSNNIQVDNNLEAGKLTIPTLTYTGNVTQTGDIFTNEQEITGTLQTDTLTVARDAFLKQINIEGGNITNVVTNSDMIFRALGTGKIRIPGNNVRLEEDIRVGSYQVGGNITFTGDILSNRYTTEDIKIFGTNIETSLSNSDLELRASGTGSVLVENLFFKNRTITSGPPGVEFGRINLDPAENLILSGTGALKFPVGNINQRRNQAGDVRFNSQLNVFEGFSTGTVTFGGLFSDDQQTSVQVNPVNNHLDFNVDGSLVGTVNIAQVEMPGLQTDDILIDGKKITTNVSNSDLELTPNGTGAVNIIGNTINLSSLSSGIIKNDSTGALTISATDQGYHKIGGTFGVRIPSGDNSNRDAGDSVPNQIGDTRFNRTNGGFLETWDGNVWQVSAGGGGETLTQAEMEDLILEFSLALG